MKQDILKIVNAVKDYGYGSAVTHALAGVSMTVCQGEFVAVMGPSGSGKTTLLNLIATIDTLTAGDIIVDGVSVSGLNDKYLAAFRRDRLGFIFQEYNLLETLTVAENIVLPLNLKKVKKAKAQEELMRVSEALGLKDQLSKFPRELSGGQRQRVACARAVITSPALVLADEPTGALDSHNSRNLMELFQKMNTEFGSTIFMVTHDANVASYSQRVVFLRDGRIYNEIECGGRERAEFYRDILSNMDELGGETDVL